MIKILLTGASGFSGCHMLSHLVTLPDTYVYCPVTFRHGGDKQRITDLVQPEYADKFQLLECDLATHEIDLQSLGITKVINFASESHVDRSIYSPKDFVSNNFLVITNLLESIRKSSYRVPLFHISTDEVYGEIPRGIDVVEWVSAFKPSNPYSASKAMQEDLILAYYRTFGISTCIFNITNMLGEAQNTEKFVPKSIKNIINHKEINIDTNDNGEIGSRKYIYVKDVISAISLVMDLPEWSAHNNEGILDKFHISGGMEMSNLDIVNLLGEILGILPFLTFNKSPREGYDLRYDLNSQKIRRIGWKETLSIQVRLKQIVNWSLSNRYWLS
jgi:dTDP-glucose 4,6-dehydratase